MLGTPSGQVKRRHNDVREPERARAVIRKTDGVTRLYVRAEKKEPGFRFFLITIETRPVFVRPSDEISASAFDHLLGAADSPVALSRLRRPYYAAQLAAPPPRQGCRLAGRRLRRPPPEGVARRGDRFLLFLHANPREHADVGSPREGPHLHRERRGRKPCADGEIHRGRAPRCSPTRTRLCSRTCAAPWRSRRGQPCR